MPEIKNNFLGSKMNKDIDDRLMPNNEYRNAINLQVNRSEGSDVGTLQNILGNKLTVDFRVQSSRSGLEVIGVLTDDSNDTIYVFLTDNKTANYVTTANNYIYSFNNKTEITKQLVVGGFLNFSTQSPIYGINLIENLLFWTDNRNQPRRINVLKASNDPNYYTIEEQISVAQLSPLGAPELYKRSKFNIPLLTSGTVGTVSGTGPYTATITPSPVFASSLLTVGMTVYATSGTSSFTSGIVTSITTSGSNISSFVVSSTVIFTAGSVSSLDIKQYETTMYDVSSPTLPNGLANPYYEEEYPGDPVYLENRYVRFSYRYKFENNEYSIIAPFTQIAFIPKQDGYFLYKPPVSPSTEPELNDETSTYRSTIVNFMQNKVNNILLQIKLPYLPSPINTVCPANQLYSKYKIVEIEILYKEADDLAIKVVDAIPTVPILGLENYFWNTTATTYTYNYQSRKPFRTLPTADTIRVYDTTPVKALSQEVAGNRVIYGNYQDKFTYPKYLDYNVGASTKLPFGFGALDGTSFIEYPNHSVKENRNYQVGVVLCDRFGRQSGVILSDSIKKDDTGLFGASTLYVPYSGVDDVTPSEWPGNSLKILFNSIIQPPGPDSPTGWPGLYNGDKTNPAYNPLGWYSYKVVVKQTEQDYYNVYLPGVMAAYPGTVAVPGPTTELGKTSHTVLLNDNINKIPRDLSEVGPAQKQFASSVILYPRVGNNIELYNNNQIDPGNTYAFVSTIATASSLFYPDGIIPDPIPSGFNQFYQINSDPLIARISTIEKLGVLSNVTAPVTVINLAVYETKPIESRLDIYWETSTTGLISDLNTAIQLGSEFSIDSMVGWNFTLSEANGPNYITSTGFTFEDILGDEITPTSVTLVSAIVVGTNENVTSSFVIENVPSTNAYRMKVATAKYFYYDSSPINYVFTIRATVGSPEVSGIFTQTGFLSNVLPSITNKPIAPINIAEGIVPVYSFTGTNSSNSGGNRTQEGLVWSVTGSSLFTITSTGQLNQPSGEAKGTFNLRVTLTEASGQIDFVDIIVVYPNPQNRIVITNENTSIENFTEISSVEITGGNSITLDAGYSFPVYNADFVEGSYTIPTSSPVTIEVASISALSAPVSLYIGGIFIGCQDITGGTVYFTGLDLTAGPTISITLGVEGTSCS